MISREAQEKTSRLCKRNDSREVARGEGRVTVPGKVVDPVLTLKEIKDSSSLEPSMGEHALGTQTQASPYTMLHCGSGYGRFCQRQNKEKS